jgi:hypothetical protein
MRLSPGFADHLPDRLLDFFPGRAQALAPGVVPDRTHSPER